MRLHQLTIRVEASISQDGEGDLESLLLHLRHWDLGDGLGELSLGECPEHVMEALVRLRVLPVILPQLIYFLLV